VKLEHSYSETLGAADVVFANCEPLAQAMQAFANSPIHVVPNGAERFDKLEKSDVPDALQGIEGPIAAYVGNLRDRIDWTLLHEVVAALPDVSFVFYGPSNDNPNADSLARHANVHMLGVVSYSELPFHLQHVDVGLVPHLNNQLTQRMNPLKVYNYFAAGLPMVSSEVSNLETLGSALRTAANADDFIRAIRASLSEQIDTSGAQWQATMNSIAWDTRVARIVELLDQSLHQSLRKTA
ncbi:MAG: glycosyltransferase, partial [Granulosicoccus sp.]